MQKPCSLDRWLENDVPESSEFCNSEGRVFACDWNLSLLPTRGWQLEEFDSEIYKFCDRNDQRKIFSLVFCTVEIPTAAVYTNHPSV